jgi:ABC-type antimicrobial peptide transport system permease subunit
MTSMLPDLPFIEIRPLQSLIDPRVQPWRIGASLFVVFGLLAMLIATVGLYAVIAYEVTQRTHEFGVRAALGATGPAIVVALAFSGVVVGLAMARLGAPWVTLLLFDTSPTSLGVFTTVGSVVLAVALVACLVPARRAALSDPAAALRVD